MTDLRTTVAGSIAQARRRKGLSQAALAGLVGASEDTISDWENARGLPRLEAIVAISRALEVSIDQLVTGDEVFYRHMAQVAVEEARKTFEARILDLEMTVARLLEQRPKR